MSVLIGEEVLAAFVTSERVARIAFNLLDDNRY